MITVRGTLNLTDVGAGERAYEDVSADIELTFSKGKVEITDIVMSNRTERYCESLGSSGNYWRKQILEEFNSEGDWLLDQIVENLDEQEYQKAEAYITAYYKDHPMPDGGKILAGEDNDR